LQGVERGGERGGPGPVDGEPQRWSPGTVHDPAGGREELGADLAGHDQLIIDSDAAADRGPADQVVSEDRALQPDAVGVEVPRRDVLEAGAFFEVADREFDDGVVTVELVDLDRLLPGSRRDR